MQIENICADNKNLQVQEKIDNLQAEYAALMNFIAGKDWEQCKLTLTHCRSAYEELFKLPAASLRLYANDIQQLRLINKQTLEFLDSLRQARSKDLARLRQARKIQQQYFLNEAS